MNSKQDLLRLIDAERDAHLQFLSSLIQTPSVNPPGDTREAIAFVQRHLRMQGISSEIIAPKEDAPNLVSVLRGPKLVETADAARNLILNGHIDVFPVNEDETWERHPFSGDVADGFVHGRGGVDMKAGTAAAIIAFSYMHRFRSQITGQCTLEVVSDEETGGRYGTKYLLEQDARKDVWKGECLLNAEPGGVDSIRFGEKGTLRLTFEVHTKGGHGAYIHLSEGAIRVAARLINRLVELEHLRGAGMDRDLYEYLQREDVRQVADSIMGEGAAANMLKPTVNVGTIRGGVKVNMIPSYCVFEIDVRLPIGLTRDTVLAAVDDILQDFPEGSYTVQEAASNPSASSSIDHELVGLIQTNAKLVREKTPLPICSMGAADCKHFRYHGVPAFCYGASPKTMGEVNERVSAQEFLEVVKVHTLVAWDYLAGG